jgi:predicted ester cyclase
MMAVEENKRVARRFIEEVLGRGDLDLLPELTGAGYADHNLPSGITPRQSIGAFRAAFPDAVVTVEDVVGEGDRVAIRYTLRGANTGPFFGMPPTGRRIEIGGISIYRFADGKMQEAWVQYDQLGIMQQLGLARSPQAAATV